MHRPSWLRLQFPQKHLEARGTVVLHTFEQSYEEMEERLKRVIQGENPKDETQK